MSGCSVATHPKVSVRRLLPKILCTGKVGKPLIIEEMFHEQKVSKVRKYVVYIKEIE